MDVLQCCREEVFIGMKRLNKVGLSSLLDLISKSVIIMMFLSVCISGWLGVPLCRPGVFVSCSHCSPHDSQSCSDAGRVQVSP